MNSLSQQLESLIPNDYLDTIVKHYPNYSHSEEVLWSDLLSRAKNNELLSEVNTQDLIRIMNESNESGLTIKEMSLIQDLRLYIKSLENYIKVLMDETPTETHAEQPLTIQIKDEEIFIERFNVLSVGVNEYKYSEKVHLWFSRNILSEYHDQTLKEHLYSIDAVQEMQMEANTIIPDYVLSFDEAIRKIGGMSAAYIRFEF